MAKGYVNIFISSNVTSFTSQKRFPSSTTLAELKGKLELITGASASSMKLELLDIRQKFICALDNDMMSLEAYNVQDEMTIHATDIDPSKTKGQFEDLSEVKKYVMSEEEYEKRGESVRAFKEKMKLGRFAEKDPEEVKRREKEEEELVQSISIGSRCEVSTPKATAKRGVVMFVGKTQFKEGYWVGVKYDEPLGKNNGSVDGQKYFECAPKYGAFVRPTNVKVGNFPEDTIEDDDDEM